MPFSLIRILCVDDDVGITTLLKKRLEKEGFSISLAHTLKEGKEAFEKEKFDAVLIDYYLPDGEGLDLLAQLIQMDPFANCIILTGRGDEKTAVDAFLRGANNYITKDGMGNFLDLLPMIIQQTIEKVNLRFEKIEKEKQLREAMEAAIAENKKKDDFLGIMSHELKTPLYTFTGFCECLLNGVYGDMSYAQKQVIQKMLQASHYLQSIVTNMLSIMMLDCNKIQLRPTEFNLSKSIDFSFSVVEPLAKERGIALLKELPPDGEITFYADEEKITQVLINLLKNGIKYTEEGSVTLKVEINHERMLIIVKDTGVGIEEHEMQNIFCPYVQANLTKEKRLGGSGLGLTIVKQFVEMHNGNISVESQKNGGSEFKIMLPVTSK